MPPKTKFTKKDVVQAAFKLVQDEGIKELTARNIAARLSSSTAPVYSCFKSMTELKREVIKKAKSLLIKYTEKPYTNMVFLNMGTGVAVFARDHKNLFRAMFLERDDFKDIVDEILVTLQKAMAKEPMFNNMPEVKRKALLGKMYIFTHGLGALICVGLIKNSSEEHIIRTLREVGRAVITAALSECNEQRTD